MSLNPAGAYFAISTTYQIFFFWSNNAKFENSEPEKVF